MLLSAMCPEYSPLGKLMHARVANVFIFDLRTPIVDCPGGSAVRATALYINKESRRSRDRFPPGAPPNL
jgi:hypothetical protein